MRLLEKIPELGIVKTWLNGHFMTTKDLLGKPVLVHFWSVSCPTCKNQLKKINNLQQLYKGDLQVVGVHMPRREEDKDIKRINAHVREYRMTYPVVADNEDLITNAFGIPSVPCYYIFDENGILRYHQTGSSTMSLFERRIHRIVQKAT